MTLKFLKSFKLYVFIVVFFAISLCLFILSFLAMQNIDERVQAVSEQNLLKQSSMIENLYNSKLDALLKRGIQIAGVLGVEEELMFQDPKLSKKLQSMQDAQDIDIAIIVDEDTNVFIRPDIQKNGGRLLLDGIVKYALESSLPLASTAIVPQDELKQESEELYLQARTRRIPLPYEKKVEEVVYHNDALALVAVVPLSIKGETKGALVLVDVLNRDHSLPDEVDELTGFGASIFQNDVRISTTIKTQKDVRFVGTVLSKIAVEETIEKGQVFHGRLWVVDSWGYGIYTPLKNYKSEVIGAIGFGMSDQNYQQSIHLYSKKEQQYLFLINFIATLGFSLIISLLVSRSLTRPLQKLTNAIIEAYQGNLEEDIEVKSFDEINKVAHSFNILVRHIRQEIALEQRKFIDEFKKTHNQEQDEK